MPTKTPTRSKPKSPKPKAKAAATGQPNLESKRDWNILFYLIGDGLISASMISQLKAITDAGFEQDTNVLVYFDPNCNGKNARIFEVNAQRKRDYEGNEAGRKTIIGDGRVPFVRNIAEDCHAPSLPQIPAEITLRYFLEYARAYYPAKNYMLILMGHGVIVGNDAFLPDPDDNSAITLCDLGWILRTFSEKIRAAGDEFHLVGFHSCSMSSAELLYELAGTAHYMIGTQGAAFPGSWPYRQILKKIFIAIDETKTASNRSMKPEKLVGKILDGLQNLSFYNGEDFWLAGFSSDISLCSLDTGHVDRLRQPIEELSEVLQDGLRDTVARNCIRLAHLESQSYWGENYTDLFDFCSCLSERCEGGNRIQTAIQKACKSITLALNGREPTKNGDKPKTARRVGATAGSHPLVIYSDYYGPAYQFSNGLSIYFPYRCPTDKVSQNYEDYKFTREHGPKSWWSFLQQYFKHTQRRARSTRKPFHATPYVTNSISWRSEHSLLRTLSDQKLLELGPPPKVGGDLSKVGGDLSKVGGDLSKVGGKLSKVGGELSKVGGELSAKVGGELSKVGGELSKLLGELSKVGGELSEKVGGELSSKVGAELSKLLGDLSKVGGELSKVGGELSENGGGDLSKVGGELSKVGGELSGKVGGELGGLFGQTVIKNFASPDNLFITSRPERFDLNTFQTRSEMRPTAKRPGKKSGAKKRGKTAKGSKR